MDRRQKKTRQAIFMAYSALLGEKDSAKITVEDIINRADVGRATFYSHFETKDFLQKEFCRELFCHILDSAAKKTDHKHIFECEGEESVYLHLFRHLKNNDNNILKLFGGENNELFVSFFKSELKALVERETGESETLPRDYLINHVAATFVETVRWWAENGMTETPEQINEYFVSVLAGALSV